MTFELVPPPPEYPSNNASRVTVVASAELSTLLIFGSRFPVFQYSINDYTPLKENCFWKLYGGVSSVVPRFLFLPPV